jgi:hypothetical protein
MPSQPADILAWVAGLDTEQQRQLADQLGAGSALGPSGDFFGSMFDDANPAIELPPAPEASSTYTLRVDITGAKPPIWRRLAVRSDVTLDVLHRVLQASFGWWDYHLHRFSTGEPYRSPYFVTPQDVDEGEEGTPEHTARLDQVLTEPGTRLTYEYDFGDSWTHRLLLESVGPWPEEEGRTAWCLAGRRAGPLEDSGGIGAYDELAAWVRSGYAEDQAPPDAEDLAEWVPEGFDPDEFSVEETDAAIETALLGDDRTIAGHLALRDGAAAFARSLEGEQAATVAGWLLAAGLDRADVVDSDLADSATWAWRVLLRHVGDGITLTKAGYLPPAVVEAVFTELGLAEDWIGRGNREDLTQPLLWLREQAQDLGLLRKAKGRLTPTALARRVAGDPTALLRHVAGRLPLGRHEAEQQAGWAVLMATAAGQERQAADHHIADILTGFGWRTDMSPGIEPHVAAHSARPTRFALDVAGGSLGFSRRQVPGPESVLLARLALVTR